MGYYHVPENIAEEELTLEPSSPVLLRAGRREDDDSSAGRKTGKRAGRGEARLNSIEVLVDHGKSFLRGRIHLYAPKG